MDVKRSVVISEAQDAYLARLRAAYGFNRSHAVRLGLELLMADKRFFMPERLAISKDGVHSGQIAEAVR